MKPEIRIIKMSKEEYTSEMKRSLGAYYEQEKDNYWSYSEDLFSMFNDRLDNALEDSLFYLALVDNELYELPWDYREEL